MIFFLILGILIGAIAIIFVSQNTDVVTVSFLSWQLEGSLAVILFLAIASGVMITMLVLFPSFVKDVFSLASVRRKNKALEEELAALKHNIAKEPTPVPPPHTPVDTI